MKKQKQKTILLFLLIPVLELLIFNVYPLLRVLISSFYSMSYTNSEGFVLFENYVKAMFSAEYNKAIFVSGYYMVAACVQVILALILAVVLTKSKFSNVFKAILVIPYMINGIAVGYIFKLFYTRGYVLDTLLGIIGVNTELLPFWLRDQAINNWALAFASVWRYTGLSLIIFIGAISSIEKTLFDASSIDGAGYFQQVRFIILPNIKRVVYLNLMLSVVSSLSEFELPYAIASGGANGTATYMTLIYRIAFTERKIGLASAMVIILLLQIALFSLLLLEVPKFLARIYENKRGIEQ